MPTYKDQTPVLYNGRTIPKWKEELLINPPRRFIGWDEWESIVLNELHDRPVSPMKGKFHSQETKDLLSERLKGKGRPHSVETKKHLSRISKGRKLTEEHKENIRLGHPRKGTPRSQETLEILRSLKFWNNGEIQVRAKTPPGPEWRRGHLEGISAMWTDGISATRSMQCPGPGWVRGSIKTGPNLKARKNKWWTNGQNSVRVPECPGVEWKPGRKLWRTKENSDQKIHQNTAETPII